MTGPRLEIEEHGVDKAAHDLELLGVRARDVRPAARQIRAVVQKSERRTFAQAGPGWPPLAEATRAKKAALGQSPRILRVTDALYRSLTTSGAGSSEELHASELRFGTAVFYARFHEYGTRTTPKRPLAGLSVSERDRVNEVISSWVARGQK